MSSVIDQSVRKILLPTGSEAVIPILFRTVRSVATGWHQSVQRHFCAKATVFSSLVSLEEYAASLKKSMLNSLLRHRYALLLTDPISGRYFLSLTAHDRKYDRCGLSMLCNHCTIECSEPSGKKPHSMSRPPPYKTNLGGAPSRFDRMIACRSGTAFLRQLDTAIATSAKGLMHETRHGLLNAEYGHTVQRRFADGWRAAPGSLNASSTSSNG